MKYSEAIDIFNFIFIFRYIVDKTGLQKIPSVCGILVKYFDGTPMKSQLLLMQKYGLGKMAALCNCVCMLCFIEHGLHAVPKYVANICQHAFTNQ